VDRAADETQVAAYKDVIEAAVTAKTLVDANAMHNQFDC